ncbi:hypothetical protein CC1G_15649 [Coprinopsis cinerea okayama7|uniref:Uncharacterized protein n=1 Tax=Coprinopsis cinerea (strain Okayama-7 / 130 / ATCC MYA-4618 / FGSC 9003) TaxID=240176 RepID=D6RQB0_COPC7|nr:hypothetical protein CC1G_15649 [Coprinopsis cinerea okayama7\|eukprot:XP_002910220.1 hypothetical protein CC1G_15649 [Coprinopsis cinerea okayama7\
MERERVIGAGTITAFCLPPDTAEVIAAPVTIVDADKSDTLSSLDVLPWLDGEREKIVLTIAFPGYKGARRKAYLIASEETGAESTVNPTLQAIATAGFSSCVSIRGPCLVLIANSVGDLVVTKRSDFPLKLLECVAEERALAIRHALTGVRLYVKGDKCVSLGFRLTSSALTGAVMQVITSIKRSGSEWVAGLYIPSKGYVGSIVPIPLKTGREKSEGLHALDLRPYIEQPGVQDNWSVYLFKSKASKRGVPFIGGGAVGSYNVGRESNELFSKYLGGETSYTVGINGPIIVVMHEENGSLRNVGLKDVQDACEFALRAMFDSTSDLLLKDVDANVKLHL